MARTKQQALKSASGKSNIPRKMPSKMPGSKKSIPTMGGKKVPFTSRSAASLAEGDDIGIKKKARRFKPGTVALRRIRKAQEGTKLMLRRLPFQRYVRDLAVQYKDDLRWQHTAILALQEAVERRAITRFKRMQRFASHANRKTIQSVDGKLVNEIESSAY